MLDELMILARIKEGDIKAFEGIFRRYYSPLCWYAAGITGDTASAEEIVEELFYVLWKNRERLQVFQSVKSYLYRSVRNEAVQFCEHRGQGALSGICPYGVRAGLFVRPHAHLEYEELRTLIRHTLDKQPRRRQQIFVMHRMEGKKYAEIALSLSLSVKTVEAEMTKVLRTLRNEIDNYIRTQ